MKKEFIPYNLALELKELGFDEPCLAKYSIDIVGETIPHFRYNNRIRQAESIDEGIWFNHNLDKEHIWSAPTYQQAFRWFREKYGIHSWIINAEDNGNVFKPFFRIKTGKDIFDQHMIDWYESYEEAELACLEKLIEIVKENKK